jgi:hypothetical protein
MNGFHMPDLTPILYLAIVGLVAIGVTIIGGLGFAIWFAVHHIQIV